MPLHNVLLTDFNIDFLEYYWAIGTQWIDHDQSQNYQGISNCHTFTQDLCIIDLNSKKARSYLLVHYVSTVQKETFYLNKE